MVHRNHAGHAYRAAWLVALIMVVSMVVAAEASSARQPARLAAACPLAGQCGINAQTNCPTGGPTGQYQHSVPPLRIAPPKKCRRVPTTLFYVSGKGATGGCTSILFVQVKLQPGIKRYETVAYSTVGEGTRWWADPQPPNDTTGPATHAGHTFSYGSASYTVPAGYLAWDVGGGGGATCTTTVSPQLIAGFAGWGVVGSGKSGGSGSATGHGAISITGPTHNAYHVSFNMVITGTASGAANYVASFEQTPPGGGCAATYVAERALSSATPWPTGTGSVHGPFHLVARFYSRNHLSHAICSYLINRSTRQTYAEASHLWSNA